MKGRKPVTRAKKYLGRTGKKHLPIREAQKIANMPQEGYSRNHPLYRFLDDRDNNGYVGGTNGK